MIAFIFTITTASCNEEQHSPDRKLFFMCSLLGEERLAGRETNLVKRLAGRETGW